MEEKPNIDYETPFWAGDAEKLVTVATYGSSTDAQPLRIALEEAGIDVFMVDENMATAIGGPAFGWVKVQVPESEAASAKELALHHAPAAKTPENPALKQSTCLACGAEMPDDSDTCPRCGWTFNVPEDGDGETPGDESPG
jgi:hypothetical protein